MANLVRVKQAYGDYNGLTHYGTQLIERKDENKFTIYPYYSASSCRAIDQWCEAHGYRFKMGRKLGEFVPFTYGGVYEIVPVGQAFDVTVIVK